VKTLEAELAIAHSQFGIDDKTFDQYLSEERQYLRNLKKPSVDSTLKAQYVRALNELSKCK
jgi:isopenicillin N synthase-like dioxygenase